MIFFPGSDHVLLLYLPSMTKNFLEISTVFKKNKELYLALLLRVEIMTNIMVKICENFMIKRCWVFTKMKTHIMGRIMYYKSIVTKNIL